MLNFINDFNAHPFLKNDRDKKTDNSFKTNPSICRLYNPLLLS